MDFPFSLHLFCRVVDNFGDIGVCWRLARQLSGEHQLALTLWVDDLPSFQKICPEVDVRLNRQQQQGIEVRHWQTMNDTFAPDQLPDVIIEGFGCDLPASLISAMAQRSRQPVWINLEYLSAEPWVEDCHAMQSLYPSLPLIKYFFFPGFSARTGGLLREADLHQRRSAFQDDREQVDAFFAGLGVLPGSWSRKISLFCYPQAPVEALFEALGQGPGTSLCLVPEGVATAKTATFLGAPACAGAHATRGNLTVQVIPFMDQASYDRLLWSCDLNVVRGEDSMVRAQWAQRPFVWQIYPQEEDVHLIKLRAFLSRYAEGLPDTVARPHEAFWEAWNAHGEVGPAWSDLVKHLPSLREHAAEWSAKLRQNDDLAANLLRFIRKVS